MKKRAEYIGGKWGVMVHFLSDFPCNRERVNLEIDEWNKIVDNFDIKNFVRNLSKVKTNWLIFTIGQNSGFYCSPNKTYDEIVKREKSRLSKRDLIKELGEELNSKNIKLIAYLPSHAPSRDIYAVERLKCTPIWEDGGIRWGLKKEEYKFRAGVDERLSEFQRNWENIIIEWSKRWGKLVSGWWIDGCYYSDKMYNFPEPPNFKSFADALRSGNKDSIIAFNPGIKIPVISLTEYEDYTAGEIANGFPVFYKWVPFTRFINNAQFHILTFLGDIWGLGEEPRFPKELIISYTKYITHLGGAITWEFPLSDMKGNINKKFLNQLISLSKF